MKQITLKLPKHKIHDCRIVIGDHVMEKTNRLFNLTKYSSVFVVTDENIGPLFLKTLLPVLPKDTAFIVLPVGEKEKHLQSVEKVVTAMHNAGCDRHCLVINLGGGVISDIGGFTANIFMRGIEVLNIPTTLLSMTDAAIGGKNGVNFAGVKNLIGTMQQPIGILIDTACLATLPKRELLSGFAEIIKHGLIKDESFFRLVVSKKPDQFSKSQLVEIISRSCQIKAAIVTSDEKEQGERKLLNFGHTVGHAVEALSLETKKPMLHGEAVAMGMIVESKISQLLGLLTEKECHFIQEQIRSLFDTAIRIDSRSLLSKMRSDKKKLGDQILWTLIDRIGHGVINVTVEDEIIKKALQDGI